MYIRKFQHAVVSGLMLSALALGPGFLHAQARSVVPVGALAHAAEVFEHSSGGRVLEIRLADRPGAPVFEAAVAKNDEVQYLRIESPSQNVTAIEVNDLPSWLLNYRMQQYMRSAADAKVPLGRAIREAEANAQAPAVDAGIARPLGGTNAVLAYFIETINGSTHRQLAVDATTGSLIQDPESLFAARTPLQLTRRLAAAAH